MMSSLFKLTYFLWIACHLSGFNAVAIKLKRSLLDLNSVQPILSAPYGPAPFAPFGTGSSFAPPVVLPFYSSFPPFPPAYPVPPYLLQTLPYAAQPPYTSPVYAAPFPPQPPPISAHPVPPPNPIIVPAKTAAALSVASIIHALIARKFYPPFLPVPVARPVPVPVPVQIQNRRPFAEAAISFSPEEDNPFFISSCNDSREQVYRNSPNKNFSPSNESVWRPKPIPLHKNEN